MSERKRSDRGMGLRWSSSRALHEGEELPSELQGHRGPRCISWVRNARGHYVSRFLGLLPTPAFPTCACWLNAGPQEIDPWCMCRKIPVSQWTTVLFCIQVTEQSDIPFLLHGKILLTQFQVIMTYFCMWQEENSGD